MIESSVSDEYVRSRMRLLTTEEALSVKQIASTLGLCPREVLAHVTALEQAGLMTMVGVEDRSPKYRQARVA